MTINETLAVLWRERRNDGSSDALARLDGITIGLELAGVLTPMEAVGWRSEFRRCPGHDDEGGRDWCAYGCTRAQMADEERP